MKNLKQSGFNAPFSHIYVEDRVRDLPRCQEILARFPKATVVPIHHYKDVFNRKKQNYRAQHGSQALILAHKEGQLLYPGSPNCQSFGNANFYYTSCMMNCVFDCEYCFLKGMYPTGNLVLFVNLEDIFEETAQLCQTEQVYLCVSYDTDLMSVEPIAGYVRKWMEFTAEQPNLTIEIRTKSAYTKVLNTQLERDDKLADAKSRIIFAYTLSPQKIIQAYEHGTASLDQRLQAANRVLQAGYPVRLCFDPMIYCPNWEQEYTELIPYVFDHVPADRVFDTSVGSFRIAPDYLKTMRRSEPDSAMVQFPFARENGVEYYGAKLTNQMESLLVAQLKRFVPEEKIFRWEDQT